MATEGPGICLYGWRAAVPSSTQSLEVPLMDVFADSGSGIRLCPADLPLVLQEQLELLDARRAVGATDAELAELVTELRRLQSW